MILLFFVILNYNAKIFMKYPFKYERISPDTACKTCEYVEDSVVTHAKVNVKIFRKIDKSIKEKEGILNDSGYVEINFDYWDDGTDVEIEDIKDKD